MNLPARQVRDIRPKLIICSLSAGDFSQYAGLPMTNDFTEKLIDVTVLRAGGPIPLFRYP
jgi:hypothetical protein